MSGALKKMKLIPFNDKDNQENKSDILLNSLLFETSPNLKKVSELDRNLNSVLDSNISEQEKFDIYTQILRNFLFFKNKSREDSENLKQHKENTIINRNFNQFSSTPIPSTILNPSIGNLSNTTAQSNLFTTPQQTLKKKTPKSLKLTINKKSRVKKDKAKDKIRKLFSEQSSDEDLDSSRSWKPYHAAKKFKTIKRIKSK